MSNHSINEWLRGLYVCWLRVTLRSFSGSCPAKLVHNSMHYIVNLYKLSVLMLVPQRMTNVNAHNQCQKFEQEQWFKQVFPQN